MFRIIPGFLHHAVNEMGEVKNLKTGNVLKPYKARNGYLYVKPIECGIKKGHLAVHRAVGMCFCDNYSESLVVDHIDGDRANNFYENLRWCTQKENLRHGYERRQDTPVRNFKTCDLYYKGEFVDSFWSFTEACRYAEKNYGCKYSMLSKHHKHKDVVLKRCND